MRNFSQTSCMISQTFIVHCFTNSVQFFTKFHCEFFHKHCALFHKYHFQEISTLWIFSPIFDKKPACEIFHNLAPAGAGAKCQVFFAKKNFIFYLTKCEKPSGKFSLGLAHIVELCRQVPAVLSHAEGFWVGAYTTRLIRIV